VGPLSGKDRLVSWSDEYLVTVHSINQQHKTLVEMTRSLQIAMLEGKSREAIDPLLQNLVTYTKYHFAWEEQLLEHHGYPDLETHRQQHRVLEQRVLTLQKSADEGKLGSGTPVLMVLRTWITDHIAGHDKAYGPFLRERGVM
jgi:hemerythrin